MVVAISIFLTIYCLLTLTLIFGWWLTVKTVNYNSAIGRTYSILIPFRNEENNLRDLLPSIKNQSFPKDKFEVILVDDHSGDRSIDVVKQFISNSDLKIGLYSLGNNVTGKKNALQLAIDKSQGDIIITTDADCVVGADWLRSYADFYENRRAKMVFGPVKFKDSRSFFSKLQTMEFASLIGAGAASLTLKSPNMCNGANLSFEKEGFLEVGGYRDNLHIASGDDEFLMHKFYEKWPEQVLFNKNKSAIVKTQAHIKWSEFYNQRKRWASKWKFYKDVKVSLLAVFILLSNLSFLMGVYYIIADFDILLCCTLLSKIALEAIFIARIISFLQKKFSIFHFIFLQFTYPLYVILFGIAANFGGYSWKQRKH